VGLSVTFSSLVKSIQKDLRVALVGALIVWTAQLSMPGMVPGGTARSASMTSQQTAITYDTERYLEDFEDKWADHWRFGRGVEIRGRPGSRRLHMRSGSRGAFFFGQYWTDYSFRARIKLLSGGVVLGFRVDKTSKSGGEYSVGFSSDNLTLSKVANGRGKTLISKPLRHRLRRWHDVKITGRGPLITVSIDGVRHIRFKDRRPRKQGTISLDTWMPGSRVDLDDLRVHARIPFTHSWSDTNGPEGLALVDALISDPVRGGVAYAGSVHSAALKTTDGGITWHQFTDRHGLGDTKVFDIAVAPSERRVVYAIHQGPAGLSTSRDGGHHWTYLGPSLQWDSLNAIAVHPTDHDVVYVGAANRGGMYRSRDGGRKWKSLGIGDVSVLDIAIPSGVPGLIYAATDRGVFKSADAGSSWTPVSNGLSLPGFTDVEVTQLIAHPSEHDTLYARAFSIGPLFKSDNGGETWIELRDAVTAVAISPSDPERLYAGKGSTVWRSDDAGHSWLQVEADFPVGRNISELAVDRADPDRFYAGGSETLLISDDAGATATVPQTHFPGAWTTSVAVSRHDPGTVYAGHGDGHISVTTDAGLSWQRVSTLPAPTDEGTTTALATHPLDEDLVFATNLGGVYRSNDRGRTFDSIGAGLKGPGFISLAVDPTDTSRLYAGSGSHRPYLVFEGTGAFRTEDGGTSWTQVTGMPDTPVPAIVVDPSDPSLVYAATLGHGVFRSSDRGETWERASTGIGNPYIFSLAIDPQEPKTLYAGTFEYYGNPNHSDPSPYGSGGVYKSQDRGQTWRLVFDEVGEIENLVVDPARPRSVYVGAHSTDIWHSSDGGKTWRFANQGTVRAHTHLYMFSLAISADGSILYMGNCGRGVYSNRLRVREGRATQLP